MYLDIDTGDMYQWDGTKWSYVGTFAPSTDTPQEALDKILTVDGAGSGLDADLLDGQHGVYYAKQTDMDAANSKNSTQDTQLVALQGGVNQNITDIANLQNTKANIASPTFTGDPKAPTPSPGDADTSIATTLFVANAISASNLGGPWAPIASPTFTGDPKAPTQSPGDNDTSIATTAFVTSAITASNTGGPWAPVASPTFTGDPKAPTPATADNDTSVATTAFVKNVVASLPPSGVPEAPNDGVQYVRQSLNWAPVSVPPGTYIGDSAPSNPKAGQLWWESDTGNTYIWYTDPNTSQWVMIASSVAAGGDVGVPAGAVSYFAGNTAPTGWLKANGALLNRTTYATLFGFIGTTYGAGDGSTTFALPDLRGEFLRAWDDSRGVDASRAFGSSQAADMLAHTHGVSITSANDSPDHAHTYSANTGTESADHSHYTTVSGNSGGRSFDHQHILQGGGGTTSNDGWPSTNAPANSKNVWTAGENGDHIHGVTIGGQSGGRSAAHYHSFSGTSAGASARHTHGVTGSSAPFGGAETRPRNIAVLACIKY
jgi:microcystin-dependent protein